LAPQQHTSQDLKWAVVGILCILVCGCRSQRASVPPSIQFSRVPQADAGVPDKFDIIEGSVTGARPGQQLVLYARSGSWWVQPLVNQPFTKIQPNSKWTNSTHLGTEYAALLVNSGYVPPSRINVLPPTGATVAAVAIAKGSSFPPSPPLHFSGYEWRVRNAPSDRGGRLNTYDPANVWTDASGALHLRIAKASGEWTCAEVSLARSLGYGTYSFVVRDTAHLEPAATFGMFTWDYARADQNFGEMAIEISRWGNPVSKNAQYIVQPFYVPANVVRFAAPSGTLTHSFRWEAGRVAFGTARGSKTGGQAPSVAEHVFFAGVPTHGVESVRMNLYVFGGAKQPLENGAEVVIDKFEFLP
jgi:hypothetical protein